MIVVDFPRQTGGYVNANLIAKIRRYSDKLADYLEELNEGDACVRGYEKQTAYISCAYSWEYAYLATGVKTYYIAREIDRAEGRA